MEQFKYICETCYTKKNQYVFFNSINDIYKHLTNNSECEKKIIKKNNYNKIKSINNRNFILIDIEVDYDNNPTYSILPVYDISKKLHSCL